MTPVLLDDTAIAWLEPESQEEFAWLKSAPAEWSMWRLWEEAKRQGFVREAFERGD